MTNATLGSWAIEWFERRGISGETVARYGISTGRAVKDDPNKPATVVPDAAGRVLVFPLIESDKVVGEKYRGPQKFFWQKTGGKRTFWNADVLDDALLDAPLDPSDPTVGALTICEGEPDALSAIECGFPLTVSVPDGAPAVPDGEDPEQLPEVDDTAERSGKFSFMWVNRAKLKRIRRFIIAVDSDAPGKRLAAELVRRLGAARCHFVAYPDGCKDLNDVLCQHGRDAVIRVLRAAKPYPVHGLYRLSDYPEVPAITTLRVPWWTLAEHFKPFLGGLVMVGGIPGMGKSVVVENMIVHFCETYGMRAAVFSPEQPTVPHMRDRLRRIRLRKAIERASASEVSKADDWIDEHVLFIAGDPTGEHDEEVYLEWVLERATDAVQRFGIEVLLIDPWNEVEQLRRRGETQSEYIGRGLRMVNQFRRHHQVLTFINVHPTKEVGKDGKARPPTPYDTDGSAAFYNKADHFLIVHRFDESNRQTSVRVAKVKFTGTGYKGDVTLKFDPESERYDTLLNDPPLPPDAAAALPL